jgi:predicted DCC family thiol-disulfide oxidoreductase YuxK
MGSTGAVNEPDVVLFDGVCGFCDGAIRFIIDKEREPHFKFAPLQSPAGEKLLTAHGMSPDWMTSYVLITTEGAFVKSAATARIAPHLRAPWSLMRVLRYLPAPLVDFVYDIISRNRYRWFGKYDACRLLTPELRSRFLEGSDFT